jgi:phosphatidylinositol alpha-mannosyltransferase
VRVAIVCPYDLGRFGGVQDQALNLAAWLNDAGHDTWVVGPGKGPAGTCSVGPARVVNVNRSAAPISLNPAVGSAVAEATSGADVVHVHEPLMPMVSLAATRLREIPKVGTFHADPSRLVRAFYRRGRRLLRSVFAQLDVVTAVSPVAAGAIAHLSEYLLVPNGLDTASFHTEGKVPRRVVFLGRDDPRKGLDVLLAAWPRVAAAVPDAELVVASGGRTQGPGGVQFVGGVGTEAKRDLLASADVFCAPNTGGESFGIVLVEAMASGCAVVASGLPGFAYVMGDAGVLVPPSDPAGLAAELIRVVSDDDLRARLRARAAQRVARFDRSTVVAGYLAAYEKARAAHR